MHFCKWHSSYSIDPFIVIDWVLGLHSPSLLWPLLPGPLRLCALVGDMAKALAVVALYPLATRGTSVGGVCSTNIHRCTTAWWSAGGRWVMIGTEVPGWRWCIYLEEFLGSSDGSHSCQYLHPHFSSMSLHIHLLQDPSWHSTFQEILCVLVGTLTLELQGLELSQKVVYELAGSLVKTQQLGPCPLSVVARQEEPLDLSLQGHPDWPHVVCHALVKADLSEATCTRPIDKNSLFYILDDSAITLTCDLE